MLGLTALVRLFDRRNLPKADLVMRGGFPPTTERPEVVTSHPAAEDLILAAYRSNPPSITCAGLCYSSTPVSEVYGVGEHPERIDITVISTMKRALKLVRTTPFNFIISDYASGDSPARALIQQLINDISDQKTPYVLQSSGVAYGPTVFLNGEIDTASMNVLRGLFGTAYGLEFDRAYRRGDAIHLERPQGNI